MKLSEYLKKNSRVDLSTALGVSQGMISQWVNNTRPVAIERCVDIEIATKWQVTRKDLRLKDWVRIWPELLDETEKSKDSKPPCMRKA